MDKEEFDRPKKGRSRMPGFGRAGIALGMAAAVLGITAEPARAQPVEQVQLPTIACQNPRATRALTNPAEPRRADPRWVGFVMADGRCIWASPTQRWIHLADLGDLAAVRAADAGGAEPARYILRSALAPISGVSPPNGAAADAAAGPAGNRPQPIGPAAAGIWEAVQQSEGGDPACGVSGTAGAETISIMARQSRPGVIVLAVSKASWKIPEGTTVKATTAFTGGDSFDLVGTGSGVSVEFVLSADQVRPWIHNFTARERLRVIFPGGTEPAWRLSLTGTTPTINAMAKCITDVQMAGVPPPFSSAPVQAQASNGGTQPFTASAVPVSPPPPDASAKTQAPPAAATDTQAIAAPPTIPPQDPALIAKWEGNGMHTTRPFHADGPWELQWSVTGYFGADLHRAGSEQATPVANQVGGDGSSYQPSGGDFYLSIDSTGRWTLRAIRLDQPAPAASPTPAPAANTGVRLAANAVPKPAAQASAQLSASALGSEAEFIETVTHFASTYASATNEMAEGAQRQARAQALCILLPGRHIQGWTGTIETLSSSGSGKGVLAVRIANSITLSTFNNFLSDIGSDTLIPASQPFFLPLSRMQTGQKVIFSGEFLPSSEDCLEEMSITQAGSMREPEFVFRFSDVRSAVTD